MRRSLWKSLSGLVMPASSQEKARHRVHRRRLRLERLEQRQLLSGSGLGAEAAKALVATYLGGSAQDQGWGIAVDSAGNALVTGYTSSKNFAGANNKYHGGSQDAFVAKVSSKGSLVWVTYLGGSGYDEGGGIAVDSAGNVLVTGVTSSPTLRGRTTSIKAVLRMPSSPRSVVQAPWSGRLTWAGQVMTRGRASRSAVRETFS